MKNFDLCGTDQLFAAITDDPKGNLSTCSTFQWNASEHEKLMAILKLVTETNDICREAFLNALAEILRREAYSLKHPLWKARKDPAKSYGPQDDITLINHALGGLVSAAEDIECLSMSYGLRAIPGEVHPRIVKCIEEMKAGLVRLSNEFPHTVHGKRKLHKEQKIRLIIRIGLAYRRHLGIDPVSTDGGPFSKLFYESAGYLGLAGGRWGDYYKFAFDRLKFSKNRRSPST